MEEKLEIGEQPENPVVHAVATENDGAKDFEGSPLGKFKDSESLLNAYNELQSAFTRKCQKLSETEKQLDGFLKSADEKKENNQEFAWKNKLSDFLKLHKNAESMVEDITTELIGDDELKNNPDGLEKAYFRVIEKKFMPHGDIAKNPEFLEKYIFNNEEIKNKIINEYVSSLAEIKNPISINNSGYMSGIATSQKFASLEDASKYVENMFRF